MRSISPTTMTRNFSEGGENILTLPRHVPLTAFPAAFPTINSADIDFLEFIVYIRQDDVDDQRVRTVVHPHIPSVKAFLHQLLMRSD